MSKNNKNNPKKIVKIDFEYKKLCYTKIVGGHYGKRKKICD